MRKAADLSEFDRGQIVMARRLGTSITETARLVGCSRSVVASIHAKWINNGDTSSRRQGVGCRCVIKEKDVGDCPACVIVNYAYNGPGNIETGLCMSGRVDWSDESRFLIHHVDGRVRLRRLPGEQLLPSCTAGHTQAGAGGIMLWGTFSWATLAPVVVQDNAPCHKARIVLEWFEEHTDEFHLMSWPPNSPDINPMEHILDVMERQLRAQTPPCPNISTLRDLCLDT
ncbi:hypothetical protein AVEN_170901-1 [Araneus ventricosus]|uniref:Tc1-like transposase DDE domain-containing protein n=1 Tax=Araneus ventricosus TaxID=182803 RepID=A0A4Y2U8Z3_ARAVE|nr:hypothetical protein AVEN_170901-1 [Araneus ventricosus]